MIEILSTGLLNSIQDLGRPGWMASGVGRGGAMDREAIEVANLLVGNDATAAGIEVAHFPFRLRTHADVTIGVTGADGPVDLNGVEGDMGDDRQMIIDPFTGIAFELAVYKQYRQIRFELGLAWGVAAPNPAHIATLRG